MPAAAVFLLVFLLLWASDRSVQKAPRPYWQAIVWLMLAVFLAGNRFNGADWINYKHAFETLATNASAIDGMADSPFEWLFSLMLWVIGRAGLPYEAVVIVVGVFNSVGLVHLLRHTSVEQRNRALALLLLIEGWTLYHEQLRQSVAVTLCLLALLRLLEHRRLAALLLWIAATGFHSSAVVAPLFVLLVRGIQRADNRPISLTRAIVLSVLAFVVISGLFEAVREGLIPIAGLDRLRNKLELYEEHDVFGGTLFTAGLLGYLLGFLLLMPARRLVEERRDFWLSLSWSSALLWTLLGPLLRTQAILIRFEHYLLVFLPLALALVLEQLPPHSFRRAVSAAALSLFAATFPLRVFLNPENIVWSLDYQNYIVSSTLGLDLVDEDLRETLICANLALFDNDFCGRDPAGM